MSRPDVPHYMRGSIETIDYIADCGHMIGFCLGNIIKYASRCEHKGEMVKDLDKIRRYAEMLIDYIEGREDDLRRGTEGHGHVHSGSSEDRREGAACFKTGTGES